MTEPERNLQVEVPALDHLPGMTIPISHLIIDCVIGAVLWACLISLLWWLLL